MNGEYRKIYALTKRAIEDGTPRFFYILLCAVIVEDGVEEATRRYELFRGL